jgi:hypothetical protein
VADSDLLAYPPRPRPATDTNQTLRSRWAALSCAGMTAADCGAGMVRHCPPSSRMARSPAAGQRIQGSTKRTRMPSKCAAPVFQIYGEPPKGWCAVTVWPGIERFGTTTAGGERFGELVAALRSLVVAVAVADAPDSLIDEVLNSPAAIRCPVAPAGCEIRCDARTFGPANPSPGQRP